MAKENFYNIRNLLEVANEAPYLLLLGERANGKSYQAKLVCLWEAYNECDYREFLLTGKKKAKKRYQFGYLRRFDLDIKQTAVTDYFSDMTDEIIKITGGQYDRVICYQGFIYFASFDGEKVVKGKEIGRPFALSLAQHYKSRAYPDIGTVLFEELIPDDGRYLPNEPKLLFSIISTIARRDKIRCICVGNKMTRVVPYFNEWELRPVLKMKDGAIDIYNQPTGQYDEDGNPTYIQIVVEMCATIGQKNQMFFGKRAKAIVSSSWNTECYPYLEKDLSEYEEHYSVLYEYGDFSFMIKLLTDDKDRLLFIYPFTGNRDKIIRRVSTTEYNLSRFVTPYFDKITKYDELVIDLLNKKKVCFSDNLCGTDFYDTIKNKGKL